MLVLGLAASYSPAVLRPTAEWPKIHKWLTGDVPQPLELAQDTPDKLKWYADGIKSGYESLSKQIEAYKPDVLVVLTADDGRLFTQVQVPQFATFVGDEVWGSTRFAGLGEEAEDDIVTLACSPDLANFIQRELVWHKFDMSYMRMLRPLGESEYGAPAALVAGIRALTPKLNIPVIPIFINSHVEPAPTGHRVYALGKALAEIVEQRPERVAIVAIGGLSHDHHRPRGGWIDYPLDTWVLEHLARGKGAELTPMYDLESDSIHGGTAEFRLWMAVAGACEGTGARAAVSEYAAAYSAASGNGFAHWNIPEVKPIRRQS
jgi:aromatic ring-opening dioxygenase catalytic subunit (LigB family)